MAIKSSSLSELDCHLADVGINVNQEFMGQLMRFWYLSVTVSVLKFRTLFTFFSQVKCSFSELEIINYLSKQQTGKILIRLLLKNQSDLDLHCLSKPFLQATCV